uniref:Uncharacterized protein n=1 Tax=Tanacetum cinerariifolium TaxID=118510 RepID=A0A6L2L7J3_TANCI|nr:hypothetical protein [Tanacetum cinerariifolium]
MVQERGMETGIGQEISQAFEAAIPHIFDRTREITQKLWMIGLQLIVEERVLRKMLVTNIPVTTGARFVPPPPPFNPPVRDPMVQERGMETGIGQEISRAFEAAIPHILDRTREITQKLWMIGLQLIVEERVCEKCSGSARCSCGTKGWRCSTSKYMMHTST